MISPKKAANAIGGKTARACESCLLKRARWYCAADDAFLCQACDSSVHSANQLASRHERVRLETSSYKPTAPAWHHGFTRKARTPRHHKPTPPHAQPPKDDQKGSSCPLPLVPEIGSEEASVDENEEQLLYRVPIFDPFAAELCNLENEAENEMRSTERNGLLTDNEACDLDNLPGFLTSDMELAEFAADVESLLGREHEEECGGVEALGLLECRQEDVCMDMWVDERRVKVEDEELEAVVASQLDPALDMTREMSGWNLGYESPVIGGDGEEEKKVMGGEDQTEVKRNIFLRLNYEAVMEAWAGQGSPWTTGIQPDFNPDDVWLGFMELYSGGGGGGGGGVGIERYGGVGGRFIGGDEGREARVSRYREKRRSRLFSKKIRYQVRKLNAEKRPRMKGRFVKRASFVGPAFPYLVNK